MIAALACETGIAPSVLLAEEDRMIQAMQDYLVARAEAVREARES